MLIFAGSMPKKAEYKMEAELYVANLSASTTAVDLSALFAQAGEVTAVDVIKDRKSGLPKGYAFITMSIQSEADKAVSIFNLYRNYSGITMI